MVLAIMNHDMDKHQMESNFGHFKEIPVWAMAFILYFSYLQIRCEMSAQISPSCISHTIGSIQYF